MAPFFPQRIPSCPCPDDVSHQYIIKAADILDSYIIRAKHSRGDVFCERWLHLGLCRYSSRTSLMRQRSLGCSPGIDPSGKEWLQVSSVPRFLLELRFWKPVAASLPSIKEDGLRATNCVWSDNFILRTDGMCPSCVWFPDHFSYNTLSSLLI